MKSTGERLVRREKVKHWGQDLWDWIKTKVIDTYFFYTGGYRIANSWQLTP